MTLILHSVDQFSSFIFRESVLERTSENWKDKYMARHWAVAREKLVESIRVSFW